MFQQNPEKAAHENNDKKHSLEMLLQTHKYVESGLKQKTENKKINTNNYKVLEIRQ